ncbi:MAG: TRAP transporter large permease [Alphaproteobacteria bacterium]|nr:TRAP transporter large permease [Alphaproteobacteria bacterium]
MLLLVIFAVFFAFALAGVPLVYALLLTTFGVIAAFGLSHPIQSVVLSFVGGVEAFHLVAVPLFIVAGELLSRGGVGRRIVAFASMIFGFLPGGLGIVTVVSSLLFGGVSGSAVAGSAAIGSVMIPAMAARGYGKPFGAALVSAAGTLAVIIPPSIPMLVYGFVGNVSVKDLFLSGVVPGILFALGMIVICVWHGRRTGCDPGGARPSAEQLRRSFLACLPALLMPVAILGGIWTGIFTPTESAAVAVIYGFVIARFVYRDIAWRDVPRLVLDSFATSAVVMVVIGATAALAWLITIEQVPAMLIELVRSISGSQWGFLLLLNIALLLLGIFIEPVPALILTAPLFIPTARAFGVDPVHLGLIMTCNLAIGLYTPPVGGTLFVAARIAGVGMGAMTRSLIPIFVVSVAVLLLVTYVPALPMALVWASR